TCTARARDDRPRGPRPARAQPAVAAACQSAGAVQQQLRRAGPGRVAGRAQPGPRRTARGAGRGVIVVPMSVRGGDAAVRDALLSLGWEGDLASLTSSGIQSAAFQVRGIDPATIEAMVP